MITDCLNNFIGLRGYCSDTTPESGLYVNDLSGVSLKLLANLAEEEQKDYSGIWTEIYNRTLHELESDVIIGSQKYFKTNLILENTNTGHYDDPHVTVTSSNELKGNTIELDFNQSRYLSVYVNSVQLYLPTAVNSSIYIYNLLNGVLLDTIAFTGTVGINTIQINKTYKTYGQDTQIFVCYDGNDTASIETSDFDGSDLAITRGAKIAVGTSVLNDNLTFDGDSYGLVVNYNLRCDVSEFICTSKSLFKLPLLYKLGSNIFFEMLTSTRMNKYTISKSRDDIKDLRDEYQEKYDNLMKSTLSNMRANEDRVCFNCNRQRNYKYNMP